MKHIATGLKLRLAACLGNQLVIVVNKNEPPHEKTNKMSLAPSEDSDQPGQSPSLIRVFAVLSIGS